MEPIFHFLMWDCRSVRAIAILRSIMSKVYNMHREWPNLAERLLNSLFYQCSLCVFQLWQCAPAWKFSRPTFFQNGRRWLKTDLRARPPAEWRESRGTGGSHANSRAHHRGGHSENIGSQVPNTTIPGNSIAVILGLKLISRTLLTKNYLFLKLHPPQRSQRLAVFFYVCLCALGCQSKNIIDMTLKCFVKWLFRKIIDF
jgi:hypothetical protein